LTQRDLLGLLISAVAVGAFVVASIALRRGGVPQDLTRKVSHVGIGTWCLPTIFLFDTAWAAVLLPAIFIFGNLALHVTGWIPALQDEDRTNLGTVWFPLSFAALLYVFWAPDQRGAAVAGLLTMAWGDAAASIVGRRLGRRKYRIVGVTKSLEGSFALVVATIPALLVAGMVQQGGGLSPLWIPAVAVIAALIEAPCARGLDNLILPVAIAVLFALLT
jgi:phytol kinase